MAESVIYEGPKDKNDPATVLYLGRNRFDVGVPVSVDDDELLKAIKDDSIEGHKFSVSKKEKPLRAASEEPAVAPGTAPVDAGPGGSGDAPTLDPTPAGSR